MNRFIRSCLITAALGALAHYIYLLHEQYGTNDPSAASGIATEAAPASSDGTGEQKYFCPMHPSVVTEKPGYCPVCHMQLQPLETAPKKTARKILYYRHPMGKNVTSPVPAKDEMGMDYIPVFADQDGAGTAAAVKGRVAFDLPQDAQQRIGVTTAEVRSRDLQFDIRASGRVVFDPQLYTAVKDFEVALKIGGDRQGGLAGSALTKLRLLGLSDSQIEDIRSGHVSAENFLLPRGRVWIYADVYENEVGAVRIGQRADVSAPGHADLQFTGVIAGINPVLDPVTRTIKVRLEVQDPEAALTPEAFVSVTIHIDLGKSLAVQEDAVIHTGSSDLAFVVEENERFIPREIVLGMKAGGFFQVKSGLNEGDTVVTAANFLIDSESRIKAVVRKPEAGGQTE